MGQALDRIKCRVLEGVEAADVRVLVLDMQGRLTLDMLGRGIEAALMNPSTLIAEPWQASSETLSGLGIDAMAVDPVLVQIIQVFLSSQHLVCSYFIDLLHRVLQYQFFSHDIFFSSIMVLICISGSCLWMQAYVDAVLDLASHFLTRLRRYASFCRTLTAHASSGTTSATTAARSGIIPSTIPTSAAPASQGKPHVARMDC